MNRRVLEWGAGALLLLVVGLSAAGVWYVRERQRRLDQRLKAALFDFDLRRAKSVVREGAGVNVRGRVGLTVLMVAAHKGDLPFVRELLARGADVNATNERGEQALYYATYTDELKVIRTLIAAGAGVDRRNEWGSTPLMLAASQCEVATVRELLAAGADPGLQDDDGETALACAIDDNSPEVVRWLLTHGADPRVKDHEGQTALDRAAAHVREIAGWHRLEDGPKRQAEIAVFYGNAVRILRVLRDHERHPAYSYSHSHSHSHSGPESRWSGAVSNSPHTKPPHRTYRNKSARGTRRTLSPMLSL